MTQELKPYTPTWNEQIISGLTGLLGGGRQAQSISEGLLGDHPMLGFGLLDMVPPLAFQEAAATGQGPLMAAAAMLPIPAFKAARPVAKALVPARKYPAGNIVKAPRGSTHGDLMDWEEVAKPTGYKDVDSQMGFATPEGKFLTRAEAREWVEKNQPGVAKAIDDENEMIGSTYKGLDAQQYDNMQWAADEQFPGAAPDRTNFTLVRHRAPQGDSSRFKTLEKRMEANPHIRDEFMQIARDGEDIGRRWYDTEALRSRFIDVLGEKEGEKSWREYLYLLGATSGGSDVQQNIRTASYYFQKNAGDQMRLARIAEDLLEGRGHPPKGSSYGNVTQKSHARAVGRAVTGKWGPDADPTLNAKPRGFVQSLMGGETNIAADRHFMRLFGMMSDDPAFLHGNAQLSAELHATLTAKYGKKIDKWISKRKDNTGKVQTTFNAKKAVREGPKDLYETIKREASMWDDMPSDNEYAALERLTNKMAREMNMTGPQFQASLWMGAAKKTKVDPGSLDTFENLFNKKLGQAAAKRGVSADDMFKLFATRKEALAVPLGLLGAPTVLQGGGLLNQQD